MRHLFRCTMSVVLIVGLTNYAIAGDEFKKLFNGKDLVGWKIFPEKASKTFTVADGYIKVTGQPNGYFYTDKSFKNYVFSYDWRYPQPQPDKSSLNSGLLLHITGTHKVWPTSLEVQGANGSHASFIAIGGKAVGLTDYKFDSKALAKARNKLGEWNTTEVTLNNGDVIAKVNGTVISTGKITLTEGPIGFQSEGAEIHFKNTLIKTLPNGPAGTKKETKTDNKKETKTETKKETKTEEKKVTKTEEKKSTKTETPKTKTAPTHPPATTTPSAAAATEERPGLFPNFRARIRGLIR